MSWERQPSPVVAAPEPPVKSRWVKAASLALFAGALLFLLHSSERLVLLRHIDIWVFSLTPLLAWVLAFGARAYAYGQALSHQRFFVQQAEDAQRSWQNWAQRNMAVCASCVVLPDRLSAAVLSQEMPGLPPRTGQARRIAALTEHEERAHAGLYMLLEAVAPAVKALPAGQELRLTLLSDVDPAHYEPLRDALHRGWRATLDHAHPTTIALTSVLSYRWVDHTLKTASTAVELILVVQVNGEQAYSDGLAGLLLCPDQLAHACALPITSRLLRPMPLDIAALDSEIPLFLQTQTQANAATGMLADEAGWQPLMGKILAASGVNGASLNAQQQWIQERFCGVPGPLGLWLVTALGVEMAGHLRKPMLIFAQDPSGHWVSTVTTGGRS